MSTSETDKNSQKDLSDDGSDASFETVEEKDVAFFSKRNIDKEGEQPSMKKEKTDKGNCLEMEMELLMKHLTTVVRKLEKHELQTIADVLGED